MKLQIAATGNDMLGDKDAVAIAAGIASGDFTAKEAVHTAIARLQAVNPQLEAVACQRFAAAMKQAGMLLTRPQPGLLSGVPALIKDNVNMAGLPTRHGSRATSATTQRYDGEITQQFVATGLIPIAKTKLPEFGLTATTEFTYQPSTRNPWNTAHSCGGSSGGSAALVAAGAVPIAHANDGGGSIRIPAACCGLVGLKPSRARLRYDTQIDRLPMNIVADGVVTRTVRDTAAFYAEAEKHHANKQLPPIGHVIAPGKKRLRIGVCSDHPLGSSCDPDVVTAIERVAATCETLGHRVERIAPLADQQMSDDFLLYWGRLAATLKYLGRFIFGRGYNRHLLEPLTHQLSSHYMRNCYRSPAAIRRLRTYANSYQQHFQHHDLLLTPVLATPPAEIGHLALDLDFTTAMERLRQYTPFTPSQNVSGTPAISLPLGQSSAGLPIGLQFAAAMGNERQLLEIAYEMEQAMPWHY
jgi:amidase